MDPLNPQTLLAELARLGVKLGLRDDGQLSLTAPAGRLNDEMLSQIRAHKAELMAFLKKQHQDTKKDALSQIQPDPASLYEPFPLGDLQTAFLMGDQEDMEYHVRPHYYLEMEFEGLDVVRYEAALNRALHRQRGNLITVTGDLQLQTLPKFVTVKLEVRDLRGLPLKTAGQELQQIREKLSRQELPLDCWPWFGCSLTLYGTDQVRLHWNNNNFFSDGYGTFKLLEDVMQLYAHPEVQPSDLTLSYRDCVLALADLEHSEQGDKARKYWMDRLPHLPGPPALPLKAGINTRQRSWLERRELLLPREVWERFKVQARRERVSLTSALFAVYAEVVACWSGSRHFLFNNMMTHRLPLHPEIKEILGNFASLYPLEVDWREEGSFASRARKLQLQLLKDMQHTTFSGVKVLQALNQVQKTPGRAPCPFVVGSGLFMDPLDEPYYGCLETPQVLLDHQFWELKDGRLWVVWDGMEACFPEGLIDAMWGAYERLLTLLATEDQAWQTAHFDLLPEAQRKVRKAINDTAVPVPTGLLQDGLLRGAELFPDRKAVISGDQTLTYLQLCQRASRVAHRLIETGTRPGDRVAVVLDRGCAQVEAVYGTLLAGAVYVPIDPSWPESRIQFLLETTEATAVLTRKELAGPIKTHVPVLKLDDPLLEMSPSEAPGARQHSSDLAYIIFTSGSTGTPKGVMIDHLGAMNTILDINRRFGVGQTDVVFGPSALHFDLSVYDLFGTHAAGATLLLPDAADALRPTAWIREIQQHGATVWNSVPALMQLLTDAAGSRQVKLTTLRTILLSGDWIPVSLPAQLQKTAPQANVISLGGATEASIWSIWHPVQPEDLQKNSIPYGRPLGNQSWQILNDSGHPAPDWVPGHLHIGGMGLAKGYWKDPQKTEAAFVHHPQTAERLYRTGDLGRYLPDGTIEFLGRADFQLKIQGLRIEPGEIEHGLLLHVAVRQAVVTTTETAGKKELIAFVVLHAGAAQVTGTDLQAHLRRHVPVHMVPARIVVLNEIPLTSNGKVDRTALTGLGAQAQQQQVEHVAPRTPTETLLASIFSEVLGVKEVSVHDDFFELGGQSFGAIQVMTRIEQQIGQRLPLSALLEGRTIAHLARQLGQQKAWSPLVPLKTTGTGRPVFLVHPAGGQVFCYRSLAEHLTCPVYGLQASGLEEKSPVLEQVEEMASLYLQALKQVQPEGPYCLGGWSSGGIIAFEMARQLEMLGETVEQVILLDSPAPLQRTPVHQKQLLAWFLEDLNLGLELAELRPEMWPDLPLNLLLEHVLTDLQNRGQLCAQLDFRSLQAIFRVFRGILRATRRYQPEMIHADLVVFRAMDGRVGEFLDHPAATAADWGWAPFTRGMLHACKVPGSHHSMLLSPHQASLLKLLKLHLERPELKSQGATPR